MAPMAPGAEGNTIPQRVEKRDSGSIHWCFTFNNYEKFGSNGSKIFDILKEKCSKFVFQEEVGESGTPHLQGYCAFKSKARLSTIKKIIHDTVHWEKTKDIEGSIKYCQKDESRTGKVYKYGLPREIKVISNLYDWQKDVVNMFDVEADDRSIVWIYDPKGNNGKTSLLKYLVYHYKAIFTCGGKNADIMNLIFNNKEYMTSSPNSIVLWNLPRTTTSDYISYNAIESIKDGLIANNKFECGSFLCPNPHVCIFANCLPDMSTMTRDRWKIYTIDDYKLVDYIKALSLNLD